MKIYFFLLLIFFTTITNATEIFGLRIYANDDEYQSPIILQENFITIEFDVNTPHPPNLQIIFKHASKNWIADNNVFLNDNFRDRTSTLSYDAAPSGVRQYTYHYKNSFPNESVKFSYSGNYLFYIVDRNAQEKILAEGRFIVVENVVQTSMNVTNQYYPETNSPYNQRNVITVNVNVTTESEKKEEPTLNYANVKTVDIYQNWKMYNPSRIDVDDQSSDTFVENFMLPKKKFIIRDIFPANEYRRLDISSTKFYPNYQKVKLIDGADLSRFFLQGKIDANGAAKLRPFTKENSDYLNVEFRLELPDALHQEIYLVGAFNQWRVLPKYKMNYDTTSQLYTLHKWIKRGVYDYQYVVGSLEKQDWIALEGNDWRTINRYTAIVYYYDERFGGFDRAVGMAQAKSPGGTSETR